MFALPNALTRDTLQKSRQGSGTTRFDSLDEMFASWRE